MRRAGFGIRLGAAAIDLAVIYCLETIASMIAGVLLFANRGSLPPASATFLLWMSGSGAAITLLYSLSELLASASPAKRLLKLHIAAVDGLPEVLSRRALRWAAKYSPVVVYYAATALWYHWVLWPGSVGPPPRAVVVLKSLSELGTLAVVGGFLLTLGSERQALHDRLAGTVVVRPSQTPRGFAPVMPVVPQPTPGEVSDAR